MSKKTNKGEEWREKWNKNMTDLLDDYENAVGENDMDRMELIYKKMAFLEKFKKSMMTDAISPNDDDSTPEDKNLDSLTPGDEY